MTELLSLNNENALVVLQRAVEVALLAKTAVYDVARPLAPPVVH